MNVVAQAGKHKMDETVRRLERTKSPVSNNNNKQTTTVKMSTQNGATCLLMELAGSAVIQLLLHIGEKFVRHPVVVFTGMIFIWNRLWNNKIMYQNKN